MLIHRSALFDVYSNKLAARRAPHEYLVHRGTAAGLLLSLENELGLLQVERPTVGLRLLEIPSCTLTLRDPPEELLTREIKKALKVELPPERFSRLVSLYASPGYTSELVSFFLVKLDSIERLALENVLHWEPVTGLQKLLKEERVLDMKTAVGLSILSAGVPR